MVRSTVFEDVQTHIKQLILDRGLAPGSPLPTETELTELLGVSRVSIREALKGLQSLHVVEIRRGSGTFVGSLSLQPLVEGLAFRAAVRHRNGEASLYELMRVREALEAGVIDGVATSLPEADLETLRGIVATMEEEAKSGRIARSTDRAFHMALYGSLGNHLLSEVLDAFWAAMDQVRGDLGDDGPQDAADTLARHKEIVAAVAAGDGPRAAAAMRTHFDGIRNRLAPGPG